MLKVFASERARENIGCFIVAMTGVALFFYYPYVIEFINHLRGL